MITRRKMLLALAGSAFAARKALADVNAWNGVSITTASTINGVTPISAINGQTVVSGGGGSIAFASSSSVNATGSASDPQTFTATVDAFTNGYVVLHLSYYKNSDPSGVTFDGSAMTLLATKQNGGDGNIRCQLWGLAVGSKGSGTYNVSVSGLSGSPNAEFAAFASAWNGVHQSASVGTAATAEGNDTAPTVTVSSAAGEVVVDVVGRYNGGAMSEAMGQTVIQNYNSGSGVTDVCGSYKAGGASTSMTWSFGGAQWAIAGIPLKPA